MERLDLSWKGSWCLENAPVIAEVLNVECDQFFLLFLAYFISSVATDAEIETFLVPLAINQYNRFQAQI